MQQPQLSQKAPHHSQQRINEEESVLLESPDIYGVSHRTAAAMAASSSSALSAAVAQNRRRDEYEAAMNASSYTFHLPLISQWGAWLFVVMLVCRLLVFVVFVFGLLMQQRDIGRWQRNLFYLAPILSLLAEYPLHIALKHITVQQPEDRRIVLPRLYGQMLVHLFTFVAFFRTDTTHFARSESGYAGSLLIVLLDLMFAAELRRMFVLAGV